MSKKATKLSEVRPNDSLFFVKDISISDFKSINTNISQISSNVYCLHISKDINESIDYYHLTTNNNTIRITPDSFSSNKPLMEELLDITNRTNRGKILPMNGMSIGVDLMDLCNGIDLGYFPKTISTSKYKLLETWFPEVLNKIRNVKIIEDNEDYELDSIHFQCNR